METKTRKLTDVVGDARGAGTPLLAVATTGQIEAIAAICNSSNGAPKVLWDAQRGVTGINASGVSFVKTRGSAEQLRQTTTNPQTALEIAEVLPDDGLFFMENAHRFVQDAFVATGILNLREPYKASGRTLVLVGPSFDLPAELRQDVVVVEDPLPDDEDLRGIASRLLDSSGLKGDLDRIVDATRGLSPFAAEQVLAMSLRKSGVDMASLWERKRLQVQQTKGLQLRLTGPKLEDIGGNAAICEYGRRIMAGKERPRALYLIDEIEKYMAGAGGSDASGVSADYLGVLLREMEDNGHDGMVLVSPPGCGKTLFANALGVSYGLPIVQFDFGAMKGKFVGDSEGAIRDAFRVANGIASGRALVMATCNKLDTLPPELRRRFTDGIWFFDLPDRGERDAIWRVQRKAHGIADGETVDFDANWTGAEIRNCCRKASRLGVTLAEASRYIVPVSKSDPASIEALRKMAEGRFLSANRPGEYTRTAEEATGARKVRVAN